MIVVPRRRVDRRKGPVRGSKKVVCEYDYEFMYGGNEDPVPEVVKKKKAVDEDLYKISPELLRAPPTRVCFFFFLIIFNFFLFVHGLRFF
ncbi:hypothetical protein HanHA300_Chr01g0003711 [Helianthus annuus]|nr:hypothetical protein HanHA300_Chr01g0003711 [Helianthus annuus]